jgi:hypothetical protein
MRTTVTLDSDVENMLRDAMRHQGLSFKEALNRAIRAGLRDPTPRPKRKPYMLKPKPLGIRTHKLPGDILAELEEEEFIRKYRKGK